MDLKSKRESLVQRRDNAYRALVIKRDQARIAQEDVSNQEKFVTIIDGAIQQLDELILEQKKEMKDVNPTGAPSGSQG